MSIRGFFGIQEAFMARINASPQAVSKRARWEQRGARYMRSYRTAPEGSLVSVDPRLQRQVIGYIEEVFPTVAEAFNAEMIPMAQAAFDAWPVDTGLSKSLLALEFSIGGPGQTELTASFASRAPYSIFIQKPVRKKSAKQKAIDRERFTPLNEYKARTGATSRNAKRSGQSVIKELVWQPGEDAADRMVPMIADVLK